jgi:hypothetical protein
MQVTDFLLHCDDRQYRSWWPGTHLQFHTVEGAPGQAGTVAYMDEWVGDRRFRLKGVVAEVIPGKRVVWQLVAWARLPARLILELEDDPTGVTLTHTIRAGFAGAGRVLDPLFALVLSEKFRRSMDEHAREEFARLGRLLAPPEPSAR